MIKLTDKLYAVEVPGVKDPQTGEGYNRIYFGGACIEIHSVPYSILPPIDTKLPVKGHRVIGLLSSITEEHASALVDKPSLWSDSNGRRGKHYLDYKPVIGSKYYWLHTALESLHSLLESKGCDTSKNWLLIEKNDK